MAGAGPSDHMNSSMYSRRLNTHGTPESEFNNFECFQNYTAPEVFVQGLAGIVNQGDVEVMIRAQKHMLQRFEKTNEMLLNCNALSVSRLKLASDEFKKHAKLLAEMKKDLDYIYKKIRNVKSKISVQYPEAFAAVQPNARQNLADQDDEYEGAGKSSQCGNNESAGNPINEHAAINIVDSASSQRSVRMSDKKNSSSRCSGNNKMSIDYVQMAEQSPVDAGQLTAPEDVVGKRRSFVSNRSTSTENSNESSDGTSDTG